MNEYQRAIIQLFLTLLLSAQKDLNLIKLFISICFHVINSFICLFHNTL